MKKVLRKVKDLYIRYTDKMKYKSNLKKLNNYMVSAGRKTSMSDDNAYPALCYAASENDEFFKDFRRNFIYNTVLEHVPQYQGQEYLDVIAKHSDKLSFTDADWDNFRKNDLYGNPRVFNYEINHRMMSIAPTTLRYAKTLQDICTLFDVDKISSVAEIGIGYAGQGRILTSYVPGIQKYSLYDLPEVLGLAKKYLTKQGVAEKFEFIDGTNIPGPGEYDFVISNYAFSELIRDVQDVYLNNVILHSKAGYMAWNSLSCDVLDGYTLQELLDKIPGATTIAEEPLSATNNCIIIWGNK
ncbi:MAG: putative sugar O-methyltransferase [Lachnospiraceae bacterium]|nr:putative sugar O-methyltransferase [Lachnospiraceae bacterium]